MKVGQSHVFLQSILERFDVDGVFVRAEPYGSGHIHDTYLVVVKREASERFIVQRVNQEVFESIPKMMSNIQKVTAHLRMKSTSMKDRTMNCLAVITARKGSQPYFQDRAGDYWRVFNFIEHADASSRLNVQMRALETGRAFGNFLTLLADFPASDLFETIPDFHNLESRLRIFNDVRQRNPLGRVAEVASELDSVSKRTASMIEFYLKLKRRQVPLRVTHNDTKSNNVLFNEYGRAESVIDLDTVMPGYVHYDFGDGIRTTANIAAEDETDLNRVGMDLGLFEAFARGFLEESKELLREVEIETLAFSAKLMTFMIGLRFLTDYLDGDRYYKIDHNDHNLQRARAQFKLLASMEEQAGAMQDIIGRIVVGD